MLDETSCNELSLKSYTVQWFKYWNDIINATRPCSDDYISPCCGYFSTMLSTPNVIVELSILTLLYSIPNYIYTHQPLANYLGLEYDHEGFKPRVGLTHMIPYTRLPDGVYGAHSVPTDGFDVTWTHLGICVTFNEKPWDLVYQVSYLGSIVKSGFSPCFLISGI